MLIFSNAVSETSEATSRTKSSILFLVFITFFPQQQYARMRLGRKSYRSVFRPSSACSHGNGTERLRIDFCLCSDGSAIAPFCNLRTKMNKGICTAHVHNGGLISQSYFCAQLVISKYKMDSHFEMNSAKTVSKRARSK